MKKCFSLNSYSPNAYVEVRDYLCNKLTKLIKENRDIIFICVGTDRSTGDSLGPLVGYKLKFVSRKNIHIYGSLENPIHSNNVKETLKKINDNFTNPYIIGIDACLGDIHNIGKVFIQNRPLQPGLAMNKDLPAIGDMSITGVVNIAGNLEFMVLQNTRLCTVMSLAVCISNGIFHFILKSLGNNTKYLNNSLDSIKYL
ncbi:spore protease YyaC [Clostridium chauvoei]|uniref:spore protease YyaC n=1 Tax=Clostridium chauvoei TaxID=46867 RepID=UPI001C840F39|nr:spore protease YyaC [Clostridium chauvoei]MBX7357002.1 spore protease YyaC [Clostridium chauvoei]MBX7359518.1 spore protease YyaC [Clostridium chauvoei]